MRYFIYRSTALIPQHGREFAELLDRAVAKNARLNLTGFLHREGDMFVQYLEGEPGPLFSVFCRIVEDRRHTSVELLARGAVDRRKFQGWRMGFTDEDTGSISGFLHEATGKRRIEEMTAGEAVLFLRGMGQRLDLGLPA